MCVLLSEPLGPLEPWAAYLTADTGVVCLNDRDPADITAQKLY